MWVGNGVFSLLIYWQLLYDISIKSVKYTTHALILYLVVDLKEWTGKSLSLLANPINVHDKTEERKRRKGEDEVYVYLIFVCINV